MSNNVDLNTFPKNRIEALTMLYLQNQDFSNKTPEEIVQLYFQTYQRIRDEFTNIRRQ